MSEQYFMSTDGSGHWYLVPVRKATAWSKWAGVDEDNPKAWEVPGYAQALKGGPENVTFSDPHDSATDSQNIGDHCHE